MRGDCGTGYNKFLGESVRVTPPQLTRDAREPGVILAGCPSKLRASERSPHPILAGHNFGRVASAVRILQSLYPSEQEIIPKDTKQR